MKAQWDLNPRLLDHEGHEGHALLMSYNHYPGLTNLKTRLNKISFLFRLEHLRKQVESRERLLTEIEAGFLPELLTTEEASADDDVDDDEDDDVDDVDDDRGSVVSGFGGFSVAASVKRASCI